jgi:hypothetical protein
VVEMVNPLIITFKEEEEEGIQVRRSGHQVSSVT